MSDQHGRGGGRGRGGGGGRGGGRGEFRGRGGGRGGGAGFGAGDVHGYGSGRGGGRGGGDFREGRGGGGGGRGGRGGHRVDPFAGDEEVWGKNRPIPKPDARVTKLEDDFVKGQGVSLGKLTKQMDKMSISSTSASKDGDLFPRRPAFGSKGQEIILWANYFSVNVKTKSLSKYAVEVNRINMDVTAGDKDSELKGRKLKTIIDLALAQLGQATLATEFKSQVVSLAPLKLPEGGIIQVQYTEGGRNRIKTYAVKLIGPTHIQLDDLLSYLNTLTDGVDDIDSFPKFIDVIDALGVILGHFPRTSPAVAAVGRARFFPIDLRTEQEALQDRTWSTLVLIRGYFQSIRPATGRLLLNANVTHGIFRRDGRLDVLMSGWGLNKMHEVPHLNLRAKTSYFAELKRLSRALHKTRVRCAVRDANGKERHIEKVIGGLASPRDGTGEQKRPEFRPGYEFAGPAEVRFFVNAPKSSEGSAASVTNVATNQYIVVADYYQRRYGMSVNRALPLVNVGTSAKPIYFPAELCQILPGQPVKSKLSADEAKVMIDFACRSPYKNTKSVSTVGRQLLGLDDNPLLEKFGITVDKQLITVRGRLLQSPSVLYSGAGGGASKKEVRSDNGSWNMRDVRVVKPGRRIAKWTYVNITLTNARFPPSPTEVRDAVYDFVDFMITEMGINMDRKPANYPNGIAVQTSENSYEADLKLAFGDLKNSKTLPEFALVVLPEKITGLYNAVKSLADVDFGFHTVCVVRGNLLKRNPQYYANVSLKFNLKAGGVNHLLKDDVGLIKEGKTMVVGYDVTHPTSLPSGKEGDDLPSQVGMVASIDKDLAQWPAITWNNPSKVEMLGKELREAFESRLRLWQKHNAKNLPENIVIFRDGVSEGQFKQVVEQELPLMRQACEPLYRATPNKAPRISLIVSVKRHQTRFYPTSPAHMDIKSHNTKSGTVVDRGVTLGRYWDFFLQAHTALKGTARPAHYTVLVDEIFRSTQGTNAANMLEKMTHDMCYLFGRATKAVSICPPAYYADILCTRSRVHMSDLYEAATAASQVSGTSEILKRQVHANLRDSMYYI